MMHVDLSNAVAGVELEFNASIMAVGGQLIGLDVVTPRAAQATPA